MKLVIKNLHLIKYKESDNNTILINLTNIFWPIVCNSFSKITEEIILDLMSLLESELEMA